MTIFLTDFDTFAGQVRSGKHVEDISPHITPDSPGYFTVDGAIFAFTDDVSRKARRLVADHTSGSKIRLRDPLGHQPDPHRLRIAAQ